MTCPCGGQLGYVEMKAIEGFSVHFDAHYHYQPADNIKRYPNTGVGGERTSGVRKRIRWRLVTFRIPCTCPAGDAWVAAH